MFGIEILIYIHFQNRNLLTNPLKKLLIIALLIIGCGNNAISNVLSVLIDIFIIEGKCKSIIYRYNDLQEENKHLQLPETVQTLSLAGEEKASPKNQYILTDCSIT